MRRRRSGVRQLAAAFLQRACSRRPRRNRQALAASKLARRKAAASCRTPKPGFRSASGMCACWSSHHTDSLGGEGVSRSGGGAKAPPAKTEDPGEKSELATNSTGRVASLSTETLHYAPYFM
jgi:hypothetical protein